ncbi:MAG: hypothetical protein Q9180_007155 [Flavoplaca navasiana]
MATLKSVDYFKDRIPNEITLKILTELDKMDLKRARITCKKLASLGGQILVVNLYLSPREKDMQVIDRVTQHPDLKKSVRNIVYDTARFTKHTIVEYMNEITYAYYKDRFLGLGQAHATMQEAYASMDHEYGYSSKFSHIRAEESIRQPVFVAGYQQYSLHAQEHGNILHSSWYMRAYDGLKMIGPIKSAVMGNSWDMIYVRDGDDAWDKDESELSTLFLGDDYSTKVIDPERIGSDGKRLVGSPSARAWLPTALQPMAPSYLDAQATEYTHESLEFVAFVKLLNTTGKQPVRFQAKADWREYGAIGLPPNAFDSNKSPGSLHFISVSERLKVLELTMAVLFHQDSSAKSTNLSILKEIFWKSAITRQIDAFPALAAMSFSYRNLAGFLFHSLPKLTCLYLQQTLLWDGKWQDIIEGLRRLKQLKCCQLNGMRLYDTEEYYLFYDDFGPVYMPSADFENQNEQYVLGIIDRHPILKEGQPNSASAKYLARLNKTLEEVRADQA